MMVSRREAVLDALHQVLRTQVEVGVTRLVERNLVLPDQIPRDGLVILRDGNPGEPEVTLSPLMYHYEHAAEVELFVQMADNRNDAALDDLGAAVGAALAVDRTLGGLCDWAEASAPVPTDLPVEGAASIKAALLTVTLHYSTPDPLI
jgi:hypothetical protein